MNLFDRIEQARKRYDVLQHPFYVRWSEGELSREDLALYASQYRHAVVALADAAEGSGHAAEECAHVDLWDDFGAAIGADAGAPAEPETQECARAWADPDRGFLPTMVALYAIESGQPAISHTKAQGLREHYGMATGPGVAYFDLHARRDHEHAAAERALIEPRLEGADGEALLAEAERVLRANWELLDGVERRNGRG